MAGYVGKGNWNEWETARDISTWLTGGTDKTQLIRSVLSGGSIALRKTAEMQVGDLAPNGPQGKEFRTYFGVECKHTRDQPEWMHLFTSRKPESWMVRQWWLKIQEECKPHNLQPLLMMKRNRCPMLVMMRTPLCTLVIPEPPMVISSLGASVVPFTQFVTHAPDLWYKAVTVERFNATSRAEDRPS